MRYTKGILLAWLADRARARRFAEVRQAMVSTALDHQTSYEHGTTAWGAADGDGLNDA